MANPVVGDERRNPGRDSISILLILLIRAVGVEAMKYVALGLRQRVGHDRVHDDLHKVNFHKHRRATSAYLLDFRFAPLAGLI